MKIIKDIPYVENGHKRQKFDIYLPDADTFKVFIYFHGGGFRTGSKDNELNKIFGEFMTDNGYALVCANYRLSPEARYPDYVYDAAACVAHVKKNIENHGKCERIYVGGSSAGAYLSMMLCFDEKYLKWYDVNPIEIDGWFHDAGQPTSHFGIMRERGFERYKVVVDESAPMYHVGDQKEYSPMRFIVSDNDMPARYEQTMLMIATMKSFNYDMDKVSLKVMNGTHGAYAKDRKLLGSMICEFLDSLK